MMSTLNAFLCTVLDLVLAPFAALDPVWSLTLLGAAMSVVLLLIFKHTTDQKNLDAVKRRIHASLFEIRLYNDDLRLILKAQLDILRYNASYLKLILVPLVLMVILLGPAFAVMHYFYGYRGLLPGETTLLEVELRGEPDARPEAHLEVPAGIEIEAGPAWLPSTGELVWRITAADPAAGGALVVTVGDERLTKSLSVGAAIERRSPVRPASELVAQMTYPAEAPVPDASAVASISLTYPAASLLGWEWEWAWVVFLLLVSIVFAFALKKPLGVTF